MAEPRHFPLVQLDLPGPLGPRDGRYLLRGGGGDQPEAVIVLRTQGGAPRPAGRLGRPLRARARRARGSAPPAPAGVRATVIRAAHPVDAEPPPRRLERLRRDRDALRGEVAWAVTALNRLLRAHRAAVGDAAVPDVTAARAVAVRVGYGTGEQAAEGRFSDAVDAPRDDAPRRRREALDPEDRLAAVLSGRVPALAGEELVVRARADIDAGRRREAALQARIALEALLAELAAEGLGALAEDLERDRAPVAEAANAALTGEPSEDANAAVAEAVARMEAAARRRRAGRA